MCMYVSAVPVGAVCLCSSSVCLFSSDNIPDFSSLEGGREALLASSLSRSFEERRKASRGLAPLDSTEEGQKNSEREGREESSSLRRDLDRLFLIPGVSAPSTGGGGVMDLSDLSSRKSFFDTHHRSSSSNTKKKNEKNVSLLSCGGDNSTSQNARKVSSSSERQQKKHQSLLSLLDPFNVDMRDLDTKCTGYPLASKFQPCKRDLEILFLPIRS